MGKSIDASQLLRRLRLRHVELLDVLGSVPSLRVAAERLNLSQPAISKMLQEIEDVFSATLFERGKSGLKATAVGEIALRQARVIRSEVDVTAEALTAAAMGRDSVLRLGTLTVTSVVPQAILALRRAHPRAAVRIREGAVDALVGMLLANEIDCVVGALLPGSVSEELLERIAVRPISRDRLCIVASPHHALAGRRRLSWRALADEHWVLPPQPTLVRQTFVTACLQHGSEPPAPEVETLSPLTLSHLLRSDPSLLGLMRNEQLRGEQAVFTLQELPVFPRVELPPLSLLTRRSRVGMPVLVKPFLEALERSVAPQDRP